MGFMEDMENRVVSGVLSNSSNPLAAGLLQMIQNHPGGLAGLIQSFHEKGLGEIVNSWVSTGQNLPISAEQLQQVLGGHLQQMATQAGTTPQAAGAELSSLLPTLIDKLTPNGQLPEGGNWLEMAKGVLGSMGKTTAA